MTIHPGEYLVSSEDLVIATVLGSCVAVSLHDRRLGQGGLNHFMLPDPPDAASKANATYGKPAMELLVAEMLKLGSVKGDLRAKVFGGGSVLRMGSQSGVRIPRDNAEYAFAFLENEGIPILASDVGGSRPRKIYFFPRTGKILLKRLGGAFAKLVEREEERCLEDLRADGREYPAIPS